MEQNGAGAVEVHGTVAEGFLGIRDAFAENFAVRGDFGAALSVHRHGRPVVDLWGGTRGGGEPWTEDTAVMVRSATKGPAAAVLHLLHQRGRLDLDAPVGTYWPEFKTNGKERVLVRQVLAHRAGLPVIASPLSLAEAVDGVTGPRAVAAQAPVWEPGTAHGYHPHTFSWLLDELVLRVTGERLGAWFAREIAGPLDLDLWIGLPRAGGADEGAGTGSGTGIGTGTGTGTGARTGPAALARTATVETPEPSAAQGLRVRPKSAVTAAYADPDSLTRRAFGVISPHPDENDPAYLTAGLPGSGAITTARALSRFYASLIGEVPGGPRLFTPATLAQARSEESSGPDRVLVAATRFGLGYMLHGPSSPMLGPGSFGHPGRGGSLAFADPETGISFAYATAAHQRSVTSDPRAQSLLRALRTALSVRRP